MGNNAMTKISIPGGWRPYLSPNGKKLAFGNTEVRVKDLTNPTSPEVNYGPYSVAAITNDRLFISQFNLPALTEVNLLNQLVSIVPGVNNIHSPIYVTSDGAWWGHSGGKFIRNGAAVNPSLVLNGNLSGQVLDKTGTYFSAELFNYNTSVFDNQGNQQFALPYQVQWGAMYNLGEPMLHYTLGGNAFIATKNWIDKVSTEVPCHRGCITIAAGDLWAWTLQFINGQPTMFGRPFKQVKGILLQMPGNLPEVVYDEATRCFTVAGYNSETGEVVVYTNVSIDEPRVRLI